MSEEKQKTAAEIEREMLQRNTRQPIIEGNDSENVPADTAGKKQRLGIHDLKKSRKGKIFLAGIFILLLISVTVYSFPGLLRAMLSEEKPAENNAVSGAKTTRLTDLNKDSAFDPQAAAVISDNQSGDKTESQKNNTVVSDNKPVTFSRSLSVSPSGSGGATQNKNTVGNSSYEGEKSESKDNTVTENPAKKITVVQLNPDLFVPENTVIPCSLDRRFVSDLSGRLTCTVNTDIYSASGNVKLIEKGTVATLIYKSGTLNHGQGRAFLMATKLRTRAQPIMDIPLIDTEAAGALGESGVDGWIDSHFWERFGGAMMLGMIPDAMQGFSEAARGNKDNNTDYTANSRQAFAEIARSAFENSVGIPPTLYKNQGEIITLITGQDLDFSGVYRLKMDK